jgi:hypothetical protein
MFYVFWNIPNYLGTLRQPRKTDRPIVACLYKITDNTNLPLASQSVAGHSMVSRIR